MRRFLIGLLLALLGFAVATPATAAPSLDEETRKAGLWYIDRLHIDEIQRDGITGEGVTIAVIDGGINTQVPELQGANIKVKGRWCADYDTDELQPADSTEIDLAGHGTSVTAMIVGNGKAGDGGLGVRGVAPDAEIWFYATAPPSEDDSVNCAAQQPQESTTDLTIAAPASMHSIAPDLEAIADGMWEAEAMAALDAIRNGADIISISSVTGASPSWEAVVAEAVREGVVIVAGTSNPAGESAMVIDVPAILNGAVAVNSVDRDAEIIASDGVRAEGSFNLAFVAPGVDLLSPNTHDKWGPAIKGGNSLATPIVAGTVALGLQNNPAASGHQILQAMIRTPGSRGFGEPEWSDRLYGYGVINPREMLKVDATEMPDENPLFIDDLADPRCEDPYTGEQPETFDECYWAKTPVPQDVWPEETPVQDSPEEPAQEPGAADPTQPSGENTAAETPEGDQNSNALVTWLLVGAGVVLAIVIAIAVVVLRKPGAARTR